MNIATTGFYMFFEDHPESISNRRTRQGSILGSSRQRVRGYEAHSESAQRSSVMVHSHSRRNDVLVSVMLSPRMIAAVQEHINFLRSLANDSMLNRQGGNYALTYSEE